MPSYEEERKEFAKLMVEASKKGEGEVEKFIGEYRLVFLPVGKKGGLLKANIDGTQLWAEKDIDEELTVKKAENYIDEILDEPFEPVPF